jgi:hypothetical protein
MYPVILRTARRLPGNNRVNIHAIESRKFRFTVCGKNTDGKAEFPAGDIATRMRAESLEGWMPLLTTPCKACLRQLVNLGVME